jgi:uncharacterized protein (DUF1697 family)
VVLTIQVALLKAINLPGRNKVSMEALRDFCAGLGFEDVRTLLQTGNVVFRASGGKPAALESRLESEAAKQLGLRTEVFVRTDAQWREVVARNPFLEEAKRDPSHLLVMCLKGAAKAEGEKSLRAAISGRETVRVKGREAYLVYPDGIGRSRLTTAMIERHLGTTGTARNWNTVLKLSALMSP